MTDQAIIDTYKYSYNLFMTYSIIGAVIALGIILLLMYIPNNDGDIELDLVKERLNNDRKALLYMFFTITFCYPIFLGNMIFVQQLIKILAFLQKLHQYYLCLF